MSNKTYSEKLRDPRWQQKRLKVMERDQFTCRDCGDSESELQVHHCFYEKGGPWETADNLLLTLCSECHSDRQEVETKVKRFLGVVLSNTKKEDLREIASVIGNLAYVGEPQILITESEFLYQKDERWFWFACQNPDFRPMYDHVTKNNFDWDAYENRLAVIRKKERA